MFDTPEAVLKFIDDLKSRGARTVNLHWQGFDLALTFAHDRPPQREPVPTPRRETATTEDSTAKVPIKRLPAGLGYSGL